MPVVSSVVSSALRLMVQTGMDDEGLPIIRSRSFNRVKPQAADEAVYNVAEKLGELQQHPVTAIRRITESDLISQ